MHQVVGPSQPPWICPTPSDPVSIALWPWEMNQSMPSSKRWRSYHHKHRQPLSRQALTGHRRTSMMTSSCSSSQWIVGSPCKEFQRKLRAQPMLRLKTPFAWTTFSTSSEIKDGRGTNIGNPLVNTQTLRSRRQVHSWPTYSQRWTTRSPSDAGSTSWKKLGFYLENHRTN